MRSDVAVLIVGSRILDVVPAGAIPASCVKITLPRGRLLAPGFIDAQVNGGGGVLLNDEPTVTGIRAIAEAHRRFGTTALLPTLITDRAETMERLAAIAEAALDVPGVLGFHLEGPFLSRERKGIHPLEWIRTPFTGDVESVARFGRIGHSVVTLAPECVPEGFVAELTRRGLRVCAGHTAADAALVRRACREGLRGVTHLFNAMSQMTARVPGVVGATLDDAELYAGIICDGLHVDPAVLRIAFRALGRERLMLVTDGMPTVGSDKSTFDLFGRRITLRDGRLADAEGTLAGAHLDMMSAVRNAMSLIGASLEDALIMASRTPAAFLGLDIEMGALRPGYRADLVAFDAALTVTDTWIAGARETYS